jgi:hypothetical protein
MLGVGTGKEDLAREVGEKTGGMIGEKMGGKMQRQERDGHF